MLNHFVQLSLLSFTKTQICCIELRMSHGKYTAWASTGFELVWHQFLSDYMRKHKKSCTCREQTLVELSVVIPSVFFPVLSNPAESREGKCPVASDEFGGCGHSRTSSYASQQSKLSGRGTPQLVNIKIFLSDLLLLI